MKEKKYILKKTVKQKEFDKIKNGEKIEIVYDITPFNCNKLKGMGNICPFSLPSSDENRICQKDGSICKSGVSLRYTEVEIKLSKSEEKILCDVTHINGEYKDKPNFIITVVNKENNK